MSASATVQTKARGGLWQAWRIILNYARETVGKAATALDHRPALSLAVSTTASSEQGGSATSPGGPACREQSLAIHPDPGTVSVLPMRYHLTDLGNARRLAARHGGDLRYCHRWKRWLVWDGTRWVIDELGEVERRAKETVAHMYVEVSTLADEQGRKNLANWALRSESRNRLNSMIELAKSEPGIPVMPHELDRDPMVLNVSNGTIDLRTGALRPNQREDLITKLVPVRYDPEARSPQWDSFLDQIMAGDRELIRYLQKAIGYALTGDTSEQVIFILYGQGANGKSTFLTTVAAMFGDYARQTPVESLLTTKGNRIPNDLARLDGARFVTAAEAERGRRMAESLVKQITGGDKVPARFLYAEWFEFEPTFKIFLATNHKPLIEGTDHAIWRRIRLIPFTVTIPEHQQDKHLASKLREELAGMLNWAVEGCLAWQKEGLGTPPQVKAATDAYRSEMDQVGRFLNECCVQGPAVKAQASELYQEYEEWCQVNGYEPPSQTAFGRELGRRDFGKKRESKGYYYLGLGLSSNCAESIDQ